MKKIVIICHDHSLSGANLSLIDYLRGYDQTRFQVVVFYPMGKGTELSAALQEIGVATVCYRLFPMVKQLKKISFKDYIKRSIKHLWNWLVGPIAYLSMCRTIKGLFPNIIVSNSFSVVYGLRVAFRLKIPHIYHIREFMELDHQITHYHKHQVVRLCEESFAIYISQSIKEYYCERIRFKRYKVLYDYINYDVSYQKNRALFENGQIEVLIAGSIQQNKGQIDAIKAIEKVKERGYDITLHICGSGAEETKLKEYCNLKNINYVRFHGVLTQKRLVELRKNIDISLVCSRKEALGRVTVEAMYYENLVIGATGGETPYLLAKDRGILYEFGNSTQLANCILYVFHHSKEAWNIIEKAKKFALETFDSDILKEIEGFIAV